MSFSGQPALALKGGCSDVDTYSILDLAVLQVEEMGTYTFISVASELERAGLIWQPEIGDEISPREQADRISILVDPEGMNPRQLRNTYIWLPTVEQMVFQFEARQAILFHAGLELSETSICYKTVIQAPFGPIESSAQSLREALGFALRDLLVNDSQVH